MYDQYYRTFAAYIYIYTQKCTDRFLYIYIQSERDRERDIYIYICTDVYTLIHTHTYIYIYIYIYIPGKIHKTGPRMSKKQFPTIESFVIGNALEF